MNYEGRQQQIAVDAATKLGSKAALGRFMGVTRQQAHDWTTGKCRLTGEQLLRLQDLLKKAACVLIALAGLAQPTESGATGPLSAAGCGTGQRDNESGLYNLRIVHQIARRIGQQTQALLGRALRYSFPRLTRA